MPKSSIGKYNWNKSLKVISKNSPCSYYIGITHKLGAIWPVPCKLESHWCVLEGQRVTRQLGSPHCIQVRASHLWTCTMGWWGGAELRFGSLGLESDCRRLNICRIIAISCVSQLCGTVTKPLRKSTYKEGRWFVMAHGFKISVPCCFGVWAVVPHNREHGVVWCRSHTAHHVANMEKIKGKEERLRSHHLF